MMSKKLFLCLFLLLMIFVCVTAVGESLHEYRDVTINGDTFVFYVQNERAIVSGVYSLAQEVSLPASLDGFPVVKIEDGAFRECTETAIINLPETVQVIENNPFAYCWSLGYVQVSPENRYFESQDGVLIETATKTIRCCPRTHIRTSFSVPEEIERIGDSAFANCIYLEEIIIPSSIENIGTSAFMGCSNLREIDFAFRSGRYQMVDAALMDMQQGVLLCVLKPLLSEVYEIPQGTKAIGAWAFASCANLVSISMPDSVVEIGDFAFDRCAGLQEIQFSNQLESIGRCAFYETGLRDIQFPEKLKHIGQFAFGWCPSLERITFLEGMISIGDLAFYGCNKLQSFILPESLLSVGESAFSGCKSIEDLFIPSNVSHIGSNAFGSDNMILTLSEENPNYKIDNGSLIDLRTQTLIAYVQVGNYIVYYVPSGIQAIGAEAFARGSSLEEIHLPDTVRTIEDGVFSSGNLSYLGVAEGNPYFESINGALVEKESKTLLRDPGGGYKCEIPAGIEIVAISAFLGSVYEEIHIPDSVRVIEEEAFYDCNNLKCFYVSEENPYFADIDGVLFEKANKKLLCYPGGNERIDYVVPEGVEVIDDWAFSHSSLYSITLPTTLKSLPRSDTSIFRYITKIRLPSSLEESFFDRVMSFRAPRLVSYFSYDNPQLVVQKDSDAEKLLQKYGIPYSYEHEYEANDWLQ